MPEIIFIIPKTDSVDRWDKFELFWQLHKTNLIWKKEHGDGSVIVWVWFAASAPGRIPVIDETVDSDQFWILGVNVDMF